MVVERDCVLAGAVLSAVPYELSSLCLSVISSRLSASWRRQPTIVSAWRITWFRYYNSDVDGLGVGMTTVIKLVERAFAV
ncbi:hypothetical protein NPIL_2211 [Nephila pilipes]|uniref:Uncharacterized protein n=1 Tax=Nephila pilipes TaxID=299642 RepID=A0A8X6QNR4_NEPPI|nr:hypothetical protein NPIL_2211 [Nephila pilipes]